MKPSSDSDAATFHALTTIKLLANGDIVRVRTVGIFERSEDAIAILTNNCGDLYEEGYYDFAVVEEFRYGLYQIAAPQTHWFVYDPVAKSWVPTSHPAAARYKHLANFATIS